MNQPLHSTCTRCGQPLVDFASRQIGVCQQLACRGPYLQTLKRREELRERQARAELAHQEWVRLQAFPELASFQQQDDAKKRLLVVPALSTDLEPLAPERRQRFEDHLDRALADSATQRDDPVVAERLRVEYAHREDEIEAPASPTVVNGCSTCRGYCCRQGGETAFLTSDWLAWRQLNARRLSAEELRRQYLSFLPTESVPDSCVYHGEYGCTLPRTLRENICNEFHCAGLTDAEEDLHRTDGASLIFARSADETVRVGIQVPGHSRQEITPPATRVY